MSHFSTIKTQLREATPLIKALNHLGYQVNQEKKKILRSKKNKSNHKLSFKFKFELENIPNEIAEIEEEISLIKNELKDNNLYINDPVRFEEITNKLIILEQEYEKKETRWLELLEMEEVIKKENE